MAYDDRKSLDRIQQLRPLSIPHRDEPEEEVLEDVEELIEGVDPQRPGVVVTPVEPPVEPPPPVPQSPLIIEFVASETEIVTNDSTIITVIAVDPDDDNATLDFDFTAEAGELSDQTLDINDSGQAVSTVKWTAPPTIPEEPTEYLIDVIVTDEQDLTAFTGDDPLAQRPSLVISVRFHCQRPDRPDAPTVTLASATSIDIQWTSPLDNGCDITDYDLQYRIRPMAGENPDPWVEYLSSDESWLPTDSTEMFLEATLTGLTNAINYEVQVRAENLAGESEWSHSGYIVNTPPRVTIVSDVEVIASSGSNNLPDEASITTTAEDDEDDVDDLTYTFAVYRINDDNTEGDPDTVGLSGTGTSRMFSHPDINANYQIQVTVEDTGGLTASARVLVRAIDIPDTPDTPAVFVLDADSIEVRWIVLESNNSDISDYDVRFKTRSEADDRFEIWQSELTTFTDTRTIITGLDTNVTGYEVQVLAKNEAGDSDWSESAFTNEPPIISEFTGTVGTISVENEFSAASGSTATSGSLTINRDQVVLLDITASDADNDPLFYDFRIHQVDGADPDDMLENGSFIATLQNNEEIFTPPDRPAVIVIQGEVSDNDLTDTETITITVENRLPTVTVSAVETMIHTGGGTDVDGAVTEEDGDTLEYSWTVEDINDTTNTDVGTFSNMAQVSTRYNAGMTAGTYRLTLTVRETLFDGVASDSVDVIVTVLVVPPDKPALVSVTPVDGSHTQLEVTWNAPTDDGGAAVTEYDIQYRTALGIFITKTYTVTDSTPTPIVDTLTGLLENTVYFVRVVARNSAGDSPRSNTLEQRTTTDVVITVTPESDEVNKGALTTITATSNTIDVTFAWSVTPDLGILSNIGDVLITDWTAPNLSSLYQSEENSVEDAYAITATATHKVTGEVVSESAVITVLNRVPRIISFGASGFNLGDDPPIVNGGTRIPFSVTATEDDVGDTITYEWQVNAGSGTVSTIAEGSTYQWTLPHEPGLYDVTVVARDGDYTTDDDDNVILASDSRTAQIRVNESATITLTGPTMEVDPDTTHTLTVTLDDPDDTIDTNNISFITHGGGGTYVGDLVEVSEGNYTQQWLSPSQKGMALVEVEYEEFYITTSLGTVSATTRIQVANSGPEFRIIPASSIITTVQELDLEVAPLEGNTDIDPDGDVVTFVWEIESGVGGLSPTSGDRVRYIPPSPPSTPAAPTVATDLTDGTQLDVSWIAPDDNGADITDYDVRYKLSTQDDSHYLGSAFTGAGTTHTIDGLTSNSSYNVQVRAQNFAGESDWSPVGTGETANDPPTIDSFTASETTIEVGATSDITVVASDIDDDDLYYEFSIVDDPDDGTFGTLTQSTVENTIVYIAPSEDGDFVVHVQVFDNPVDSRNPDVMYPTETVTITVINVPDKPDAPTVITWINDTTQDIPRSSIIVTWTAPDDNGSAITRYIVGYRKITDTMYTNWPLADDFTDLTTTITGLEPDTIYRVRVRAVNSVSINMGLSDWSDDGEGETADDVPSQVDGVSITAFEDEPSELRVDWTEPDDNGSDITDYDIQYREQMPIGSWQDWEGSVVSTDLFTLITGLDESTTYGIRVRAVNAIGNGDWSGVVIALTGETNQPATVTITGDQKVQVGTDSDYTVTVVDPNTNDTWTGVWRANRGAVSPMTASGDTTDQTATTTYTAPATPGEDEIHCDVTDSRGLESSGLFAITVTDVPDQVTGVEVDNIADSHTSLSVDWSKPDDNGETIDQYQVRYVDEDDTALEIVVMGEDTLTADLTSLSQGRTYEVQVRARNTHGYGEYSEIVTHTTTAPPNEPPVIVSITPEHPILSARSVVYPVSTIITVVATDVLTDPEDLIYTFTILPNTFTFPGNLSAVSESGVNQPHKRLFGSLAGLNVGIRTIQVEVSDGDENLIQPTATTTITVVDRPRQVTGVTVDNIDDSHTSLRVNWTKPNDNGRDIDQYQVRYVDEGDTALEVVVTGEDTLTTDLTGLTQGTTYEIQVRAQNNQGYGQYSRTVTHTTTEPPNEPPTVVITGAEKVQVGTDSDYTATVTDADADDTWTGVWDSSRGAVSPMTASGTQSNNTATTTYTAPSTPGDDEISFDVQDSHEAAASDTFAITVTDVPAQVTGVVVANIDDSHTSLSVTWTKPDDNGEDIDQYQVRYVDENDIALEVVVMGEDTLTTDLTSLTQATTYDVQVRARNTHGYGQYSEIVIHTTTEPPNEPPTVTITGDQKVQVGTDSDYTVTVVDTNIGDTWTGVWASSRGAVSPMTASGTQANNTATTTYTAPSTPGEDEITFDAQDNHNAAASATFTITVTDVPAQVSGVVVENIADSHTSLSVDWNKPDDNGETIDQYQVRYVDENDTALEVVVTGEDTLTTDLTGLTQGTTYEIQVRARNTHGYGEYSIIVRHSTTAPPNTAPTIDSITSDVDVVLLQGETHGTLLTSATITVTATDDTLDAEDLTYTFSASIGTVVQDATDPNIASFSSTELGVATITVGVSDGDTSQTQPTDTIDITVIKRPDAPNAPTVMEDPNNSFQLLVGWDEPTTNFSPITDYDVQYKKSNQPDSSYQEWNAASISYIRTSATVDGLDGNTEYDVRVRAANIAGEGDWSDAGTGSTRNTAPTITSFTASPESVPATQDSTITVIANDIEGDTLDYVFSLPHETMDSDHGSLSLLITRSNVTTYTAPTVAGTYTIRVVVSGGGLSVQRDLSIVVTSATPPRMDAPTVNPHDDADTLIIRWTAPDYQGPVLSYNIRYKLSSVDSYTIYADSGDNPIDISSLFLLLSGLSSRTQYDVQVRAINSIGTGDWSPDGTGSTRRITARVPDAPDAPIVNTIFGLRSSLEVIWDHPNDNGSDITDYNMQYREVGAPGFANSRVTGAFTYRRNERPREPLTSHGLSRNTTYEVRVQARNAIGTGPWSPVGLGTTDENYDPPVPDPPDFVSLFPHSSATRLNLVWESPQDVFDEAISDLRIRDYDIEYQTIDETDWTSRSFSGDGISTVLTGLDRNTEYYVRVRASNRGGESEWSDEASDVTDSGFLPGTVPDAPSRPTPSDRTHNSFVITWSEPDDNGYDIQDYDIQYRETDSSSVDYTWRFWDTVSGLTWDLVDLVPNTNYQVRVRAYNDAGFGEWSSQRAHRTLRDPSPTVAPPDKAVISSVTAMTPTSLRVLWEEPDDNQSTIIDYDVEYRTTTPSDGTWIDFPFFGTPSLVENTFGVDIINLEANTEYEIRLRAVNEAPQDDGNGEWSDSVTATTLESPVALPPQVPVISSITSPAADTLRVSWIAPPIDSNPDTDDAVTDYDVQYRLPTDDDYTDWPVGSSFTSTTTDITGLSHNTEYQVRVQATNSAGPSGYGDPTRGTTAFPVPDPPENLMVSANITSTKLNVSWDVPNLFGGQIVDYDLQYREGVDDGETENTWLNWPATDTINTNPSETIDSLTADTEYDVRVRAESNSALDNGDGAGVGDWTEVVSGSTASQDTAARVPDAPVITEPSTNNTTSDSSTDITLSWSNPNNNGAIITGFYVEYKTVASNAWLAFGRVSSQLLSRTATVDSLTPNTRYQVRVYARNSVGDSPYSPVRTIRTGMTVTPPPAPSVSVTGVMPTSLAVTWLAPQTTHTITSYDVEYKLYSALVANYQTWTRLSTGLSETITGLSEVTRYNIRVRAVVDDVDGAWGVTDGTTGTSNLSPRIIEFRSRQTQIQTNQTAEILVFATDANTDPLTYELDVINFDDTDVSSSMVSYGTFSYLGLNPQSRRRYRFTPPDRDNAPGVYEIQLTVSDGSLSVTDTLSITVVAEPNNAPSVDITGDASVNVGETAVYTVTVEDQDDGDTWSGEWDSSRGSVSPTTASGTRSNQTATTTYTAPSTVGLDSITFDAQDNHGAMASDTLEIDVLGAPDKVTGVLVSNISGSHTSLRVSWNKPNDGGATIDRYEIRYVDEDDTVSTTEVTGENTSIADITGLDSGEEYEIQVRAHNSVGWGSYSDIVRFETTSPADTNTAPTVEIQIGGSSVSQYEIDAGDTVTINAVVTDDQAVSQLTYSWSTGATTSSISYQAPSTQGARTIRVTVTDAGGLTASDSVVMNVVTKPARVTGVSVSDISGSNTSLRVSWNVPNNGGTTIDRYEIRYVDESDTVSTTEVTGQSTSSATITGLNSDEEYDIQVRAHNSVGWGDYSTTVMHTTTSPAVINEAPTVEIQIGGSSVSEYEIDAGDTVTINTVVTDDQAVSQLTYSWSTGATTSSISYQAPSTQGARTIRVTVTDAGGLTALDSVVMNVVTVPARVTGVEVDDVSDSFTSLDVSWNVPNNGGATIDRYEIRYVDESDTVETTEVTGQSTTSETITGLDSGEEYEIQVRAHNSVGWGNYSTIERHTTPTEPNEAPTVEIQIGGSSVSEYEIGAGDTVTINAVATDDQAVSQLTYSWTRTGGTFLDFENDRDYQEWRAPSSRGSRTIRVTVTDAGGLTALDSVVMNVITVPARVTGVEVDDVSGSFTSLDVSWDVPGNGGATIDKYEIRYVDESDDVSTTEVTGENTTSATITGLDSGEEYEIQVRAHNSVGWGNYSTTVRHTTPTLNLAPTVEIQIDGDSVSTFTVQQLATVRIDAVTTDDSDTTAQLTFSWARDDGTFLDFEDDRNYQEWRAPGTSGSYDVTVTVEDTGGLSVSDTVTLVVPNNAPTITSLTEGSKVCPRATVVLDVVASDQDTGDTLRYTWIYSGVGVVQNNGRRLRWVAPSTPGSYTITVTVRDPEDESESESTVFTVNDAPSISVSAGATTVDPGDTVTITTDIDDPDDSLNDLAFRYQITGGSWDGNHTLSGTEATRVWESPTVKGTYTITVTVSDDCGSDTDDVTITVRNSPPVPEIDPSSDTIGRNETASFQCNPDDPDGLSDIASYRWSVSGSNSGSFDNRNVRVVVYTPGTSTGTFTISCLVRDRSGATGTGTASITVEAGESPTVTVTSFDTDLDPNGEILIFASTTNFNEDESGSDVTWSTTGGRLRRTSSSTDLTQTFTAPNGVPAGTTYTITATVESTDGSDSDSIVVTINNVGPTITSITGAPSTVRIGGTFNVRVFARDPNGDNLRYAWSPISLFVNTNQASVTFRAPSRTSMSDAIREFQCIVTDIPSSGYTSRSDVKEDSVIVVPNNPGLVLNFAVADDSTDEDTLAFIWDAPDRDGGAPITGYDAELYRGSTLVDTEYSLGDNARSVVWFDLDGGTTYRCQVRPTNKFEIGGVTYGNDGPYFSRTGTTDELDPTVSLSAGVDLVGPGGETTITADIDNLGSGSVTWTRSGGSLIGSSNTSRTFRAPIGVEAGTEYTITVTVTNNSGTASDSVSIFISNVAPTVGITGVPATVGVGNSFGMTAAAGDINDDDIDYQWDVDRGTLNNDTIRSPRYTAPDRTSEDDAEVYIEVEVTDDPPAGYDSLTGFDDDTVIVVPDTPSAPRNLTNNIRTLITLGFTWNTPSNDGGAPIISYTYILFAGSTLIESGNTDGSNRSVEITGLDPGTEHTITIFASNAFTIGGNTYGGLGGFTRATATTLSV